MSEKEPGANHAATLEEIQQGWPDLKSRVGLLEAEQDALEKENKTLRFLLERLIEHRQKSHGELVLLLTTLVSKLPINDVGTLVARLVEHNEHVNQVCSVLAKGNAETVIPKPTVLKALEETKRDLLAAVKPVVEELIQLDTPMEADALRLLITQPESFFSPAMVRATRCFIKGQVPRERIARQFGEESLVFFNDMTTDAKLNPRPKPEEIVLNFKSDFETLFQQNGAVGGEKRAELHALYEKVQRSKGTADPARAARNAFQRLSFIVELLHYYDNQNTEAPDVIFAQRLPVLVEQLVITSATQETLDEKLVVQAETLLAFIINPDHRLMVINNMGKSGGIARTLRYVLMLRIEKVPDLPGVIAEFVKHLIPKKAPKLEVLTPALRMVRPETQRFLVRAIMDCDRIRKDEADALGKAAAKELGITLADLAKAAQNVSPEVERQLAWEKIKLLITGPRSDPAAVATAFRTRLHAKYDADEMKQSWITLTEADPISLIRVFCQLPYLPDGKTDSVARAVMETYVTRLTHEKYAATYQKIVSSLKNMHKANPHSPTLMNFMALVKWVDAEAAARISADIGMPVPAAT